MSRSNKWVYWMMGGTVSVLLLVIGACLLFLYAIGNSFWGSFDDWDQSQVPWTEAGFALPDSSGNIVLLRQHAHPFLAEYNRKLRLDMNTQPSATIDLPMNTGGKTLINVYLDTLKVGWQEERVPMMFLNDRHGIYGIDMSKQQIINTAGIRSNHLVNYLGRFDSRKGELRYVSADKASEEVINRPGLHSPTPIPDPPEDG